VSLVWDTTPLAIFSDLVRKAGLTNSIGNDFFGRRIVFPIENLSRRTIGFGARTLDETNPVKYLNLECFTALIKLWILVEGYFDAVVLSQEGFSNVVAILGTTVIRRATFLLDSDDAGIMAALKAVLFCCRKILNPLWLCCQREWILTKWH